MYSDHDLDSINRSIRAFERLFSRTRIFTILTELILRATSLKTTEWLLSFFQKNIPAPEYRDTIIVLDRYATIFNKIKQLPFFKGRCLSQSLVLRLLLNRKGISSELKIGVSHQTGKFDAHAWLEKDGILLNDHPSVIVNYFVLPSGKTNAILK